MSPLLLSRPFEVRGCSAAFGNREYDFEELCATWILSPLAIFQLPDARAVGGTLSIQLPGLPTKEQRGGPMSAQPVRIGTAATAICLQGC